MSGKAGTGAAQRDCMWQRFTWRGHQVVVIQQWTDPFGRPMLRFADPDDEEAAAGMRVDEFLAEAKPVPG